MSDGLTSRSGVSLEGIDEIVEGSLEDREEPESTHYDPNDWDQPEEMRVTRPCEEKESTGENNASQHHRRKASFRYWTVVVCSQSLNVESLVDEVGRRSNEDANEHGDEWESADYRIPTSKLLKLDGQGCQEAVENAVAEAGVQCHKEADWCCQNLERADQVLSCHFSQ